MASLERIHRHHESQRQDAKYRYLIHSTLPSLFIRASRLPRGRPLPYSDFRSLSALLASKASLASPRIHQINARPASGSAHHRPKNWFRSNPARATPAMYRQTIEQAASPRRAGLPRRSARARRQRQRAAMIASEAIVSPIPSGEAAGSKRNTKATAAERTM